MTKKDLLNVSIKIFGLYYFVRFFQHFTELIFMVAGSNVFTDAHVDAWVVYAGIFVTTLVDLGFAYLATFRTDLLTNRISGADSSVGPLTLAKIDLIEISLSVISVLAIVYSIPSFLAQVVDTIYFHDNQDSEFWTRPAKHQAFQALFTLAIAIFLLLNSRNFAKRIANIGKQDDLQDEGKER